MSQDMKTRAPVTDKDFGPKAKRPYEDDDEAGPGAKGKKKEKKPKDKKTKDSAKNAEPGTKARTHPLIVTLLTLLFAVLLAATGLFLLYLDVGGIKAPFVDFFLDTPLAVELQDNIFLIREQVIDEREASVTQQESYNREWQLDLEARHRILDREIADFERRQRLAEEEDEFRAAEIARLEDLLTGRMTFEEVAAPYARMDVDAAAAILAAMDNTLALRIFGTMSTARRASVLEALPEEVAVRFTEDAAFFGYWYD